MKEQFSGLAQKAASTLRLRNETADRDFIDALDMLEALHNPDTQIETQGTIVAEIQELADQMGVHLLDLDDPKLKELAQLPLREIENRLGVSKADLDYGRTKYIDVFPREHKETPEEIRRSEMEYIEVTDKLLQEAPQIEEEYRRLLVSLTRDEAKSDDS
jgi:hypothetical protein